MTPSALGNGTVSFWADEVTATAAWYAQFLGVEAYFTRPGPDGSWPTPSSASAATRPSWASSTAATACRARRSGAHGRRPTWPRPRRWQAAYESQRAAAVPPDLAAALATDARAKAAFERLGKSGRYAVILPLLKARTAQTRARILARGSRPTGRSELTHMTAARPASPRAARRCSPDRGYGAKTGVGRIALLH